MKCPVCGDKGDIEEQSVSIRYCRACKFQWSMELSQALLVMLAVDHVKAAKESAACLAEPCT